MKPDTHLWLYGLSCVFCDSSMDRVPQRVCAERLAFECDYVGECEVMDHDGVYLFLQPPHRMPTIIAKMFRLGCPQQGSPKKAECTWASASCVA